MAVGSRLGGLLVSGIPDGWRLSSQSLANLMRTSRIWMSSGVELAEKAKA